jgi:hypothetical protein
MTKITWFIYLLFPVVVLTFIFYSAVVNADVDYWAAQAERDATASARRQQEAEYEERRYQAEQDHERGYENDDSYHRLDQHNDNNKNDW